MNLRNRWFLLLAGILSAALIFGAACGGDDDDDTDGDGDTTPAAEETTDDGATGDGERADGGELTVNAQQVESFDPHFSSFAQDISVFRMLWRGMMSLDDDSEPYGAMASGDPEISEDGLTYTFTLRDGLLWSDGEPLTAEDFEYGLLRTCNPANAGNYQYVLTAIVGCDAHYGNEAGFDQALEDAIGVTAVDETTLEVKLSDPQPTFPIIMSLWMTFPAPKHLFQTTSDPWPTDPMQLAFNGPYKVTGYTQGDSLTLEPNENWAAPNDITPTLDTLTLRFIDDASVSTNAFRNGELDFAEVDITQLRTIVDEFGEGEEYFKYLLPSTRGLQMNMEDPTLADLDVRLALARAINRPQMVEVVTQGANEPTTSWIPEVRSGVTLGTFDDVIGFDPDAAKQHLADAGYPDGAGFPTMTILVGDSASARATAEYLQQNFKEILNIDVEIEVVDSQTRSSRFTNEQFQLFPGGWIEDYPDMENWILGQYDTEGTLNHYNCSNPEIDALIEQATFNTNNEERQDQYRQIEALIIENVCGIAPYWHENNHYLVDSGVIGMAENISGQDAFSPGDWKAEAWGVRAE